MSLATRIATEINTVRSEITNVVNGTTPVTKSSQLYINNDDTGDTNCPILFSQDSTAGYKSVFEDSSFYFDNTSNYLYTPNATISGTLNVRGAIDLADNDILRLGSSDDAELFCDGSHMYMDLNAGIGNFYIRDGSTVRFTFDDAGHFTATGNISSTGSITAGGTVTAPTFSGALSGNASTATWADTVDVNSGNTSSSWYDVVWHSGDSVYSSSGVEIQGSTNSLRASQLITGGITMKESADRADLLEITSATSGWAGIQVRNSSNEGRWSLMTDGATFGVYDDENNEWATQHDENGDTRIYHNGIERLRTHSSGIDISSHVYIDGNIYHNGDTNTYTGFHAADQWRVVTGGVERLEVNNSQVTITNGLTVSNGDITLGGTGRIQGIDTVSSGTDAASKAYVDSKISYSFHGFAMEGNELMYTNETSTDIDAEDFDFWNGSSTTYVYENNTLKEVM